MTYESYRKEKHWECAALILRALFEPHITENSKKARPISTVPWQIGNCNDKLGPRSPKVSNEM